MKVETRNDTDLDVTEEKSIKNTKIYLRNLKLNQESYETKILSEESIDDVIKFQIVYENENSALVYDVGNSISLEEYLKNIRLSKQNICEIITAIDDVLMSIENYLISENSISLDPRLVRVLTVKNSRKFRFIVIPNYNGDFSFELSKLIIRILRYIDVNDKAALNLAYGLFVKSSKENYLISDLMQLIDRVQVKDTGLYGFDEEGFAMYDDMIDYEKEKKIFEDQSQVYISEEELIDEQEINHINNHKSHECDNKIIDNGSLDEINEEVLIDDDTKEFLEDEIYEDFDKEDKKIIKFNRAHNKSRKRRKLNAHINMSYMCSFFAPIILLIVPIVYFVLNGQELFMKNIAIIIVFELIVAFLLIVNRIKNFGMKSI